MAQGFVDPQDALRDLRERRAAALRAELAITTDQAQRRRLRRAIRRETWPWFLGRLRGQAHF